MRIAFVGKGGSGKTTLSALFTEYLVESKKPILVFDADLNIHLPELLGLKELVSPEMYISKHDTSVSIKKYLIGDNYNIKDLSDFKKTTLPAAGSNFIDINRLDESVLKPYLLKKGDISLAIIGTYEDEKIGKSCYHGNLIILENILNHLIDTDGYVVADMVAGVDAFANTLHSQFDVLAIIVEPTKRSIDVFEHYNHLAKHSNVHENLFVIANKIRNDDDRNFILEHIPKKQLIGFFDESEYLRNIERTSSPLDIYCLEKTNIALLEKIKNILEGNTTNPKKRFERIKKLDNTF